MTGYVRVDTSNNIADGNVISAADLDNEFDGIQAAFNASTGHNHDGTTGEGAPISVLGPTQDIVVSASTVLPKTTNTVDIGSSSLKFKDLYLAGNASIAGTLGVTGVATLTANPVLSAGTANAVAYLNGSKVLTTGSALTFDGTNLGVGTSSPLSLFNIYGSNTTVYTGSGSTTSPIDDAVTLFVRNSSNTSGTMAMLQLSPTSSTGVTQHAYIGSVSVGGQFAPAIVIGQRTGSATWAERMRISSAGGLSIGTTTDAGAGGLNITGNAVLGDASTDTVTVNGYMGVGVAPNSAIALYARGTALTGTTQTGVYSYPTATSAATVALRSFSAQPGTADAVFTVADVAGFYAFNPVKGAASTITNAHGLYIVDQTQGTNNYGITSLVSSGTNKWNIYASGTAANYFAGNVGIGTSSPVGNLDVAGTTPTLNIRDTQSKVSWAAGDIVATLDFYSNDTSGVGAQAVSRIRSVADTASAATSGALAFWTAAAGAAATEKLRITSAGNVGIGITTPTYALDVVGDIQAQGRLLVTAAAPELLLSVPSGGLDSRIYNDGSGNLIFGNGTNSATPTERMRIDSSGNVGIGTSSPGVRLDVQDTASDIQLRLGAATGSAGVNPTIRFQARNAANSASRYANIKLNPEAPLLTLMAPAGSSPTIDALNIDSSGNVGIGTSSPRSLLNPSGSGSTGAVLTLENSNTALTTGNVIGEIDFYANDASTNGTGAKAKIVSVIENSAGNLVSLTFATSDSTSATGVERMRLDSAGNLGLGVTPSAWGSTSTALQNRNASFWATSAAAYLGYNYFFDGSARKYIASSFATEYTQLNGQHIWYNAPSGTAGNAITFTQAMTLDASGNLGIGTTSPTFTSGSGLEIERTDANATVRLQRAGTSPSSMEIRSGANTGEIFVTSNSPLLFATNGTERARIDASGNVQVQAGAVVVWAPAPASISTTATLTNANIQGQIINTTGTSYTVTMPLGTTLETLVSWAAVNLGYDFTVINTASGTITMAINTGVTSLGGLTIATGTSAQFRIRRTATNTFVLYRMG
jgi:hypothetical protein